MPKLVIPRTLIVEEDPGCPELAAMVRPDVLPCKDCSIRVTGRFSNSVALTLEIAPVTTLFFCVPYPTTTTSSRAAASSCRFI